MSSQDLNNMTQRQSDRAFIVCLQNEDRRGLSLLLDREPTTTLNNEKELQSQVLNLINCPLLWGHKLIQSTRANLGFLLAQDSKDKRMSFT
jgi:hypothetical protein